MEVTAPGRRKNIHVPILSGKGVLLRLSRTIFPKKVRERFLLFCFSQWLHIPEIKGVSISGDRRVQVMGNEHLQWGRSRPPPPPPHVFAIRLYQIA